MGEREQEGEDAMDRLVTYDDYLGTKRWAEIRAAAIEQAGGCCERCGSTTELQAHHEVYPVFGTESPGDLTVLCKTCHTLRHQELEYE